MGNAATYELSDIRQHGLDGHRVVLEIDAWNEPTDRHHELYVGCERDEHGNVELTFARDVDAGLRAWAEGCREVLRVAEYELELAYGFNGWAVAV